ncbi:GNAT family N-acetyltransferase [Flavobacteriaceae bacterium F89]|uniref:GNAT family N-acetyltransferase n=1 Tax=Cerina litoralis TaxID=2874477 RepID=A0AAE3EX02_9FLAO|nr:GNAT family N-acetyltransferase [Cerina litoralis]MCG2462657.1 GNAT family N-acetyltransferase [Cerina litoralis]
MEKADMTTLARTNSDHPEFKKLVKFLNSDLAARDGEHHPLSQFNVIDAIRHVVLVLENNTSIGCGAISKYDPDTMEIKRMYVSPNFRGKGIATSILYELEKWAKQLGSFKCVLFMGSNQPEAARLYKSNGYKKIKNYGKLTEIPDSQCFLKEI